MPDLFRCHTSLVNGYKSAFTEGEVVLFGKAIVKWYLEVTVFRHHSSNFILPVF